MAVAGRKPQEDRDQVRHRVPPRHDWTDVEDVPFTERPPVTLPTSLRARITEEGDIIKVPVHAMTKAWWKRIKAMPHCVLWRESDWQFALETAVVADALFYGTTGAATELRQREKILGTTIDSRRDLRIRYVEPKAEEEDQAETAGGGATVANINDYRGL